MSSRIKVVLLDKAGQVRDYRMQGVKNYVRTYFPQVVFTGNRAKDLKIAKEKLLELDLYLFSWKEAKEARGREKLVKIFQKELKTAQNKIVSRQVIELVNKSLGGKKLESPEEPKADVREDWPGELEGVPIPQPARLRQPARRIVQQRQPAVQELLERLRVQQNER